MAEETFETLHGGGGATITTGVDLGAAVGASEAARQTAGGGDGGGGGADDRVLAMPPRLASFSVYYDEAAGGLKVFEPLVVAPTGEVEVTCPDEIGDGTYYCNVTRDAGGEGYGAAVESSPASAAEGAEAVCSVKLFTVSGDEVTQYHTGAVVVGATALKIVGDSDDSEEVDLGAVGAVSLSGSSNGISSGLEIKTTTAGEGQSAHAEISIAVKGQPDNEPTWGAHKLEFKDENGKDSYIHFLGCKDAKIQDVKKTEVKGGTAIKVAQKDDTATVSNTGVTGLYGNRSENGDRTKLNGSLSIVCESASGLEFVTKDFTAINEKDDYTGGRLVLDFITRDPDTSLSVVSVYLGGETEPVAKVVGSTDLEIAQRKLVAGKGIKITESADGSEATISAEGEETPDETFTGKKTVVVDVDYDEATHSLRKRTATVTVKDGRIVKWIEAAAYVGYTTAVEES